MTDNSTDFSKMLATIQSAAQDPQAAMQVVDQMRKLTDAAEKAKKDLAEARTSNQGLVKDLADLQRTIDTRLEEAAREVAKGEQYRQQWEEKREEQLKALGREEGLRSAVGMVFRNTAVKRKVTGSMPVTNPVSDGTGGVVNYTTNEYVDLDETTEDT